MVVGAGAKAGCAKAVALASKVAGAGVVAHAFRTIGMAAAPALCVAPVAITFAWVGIYEASRAVSDAVLAAPPAHETRCALGAAVAEPLSAAAFLGARLGRRHAAHAMASAAAATLPPSAALPPSAPSVAAAAASMLRGVRFHCVSFAGSAAAAAIGGSVARRACRAGTARGSSA